MRHPPVRHKAYLIGVVILRTVMHQCGWNAYSTRKMQYLCKILQWAQPLIIYSVWYVTWKVATCSLPELTCSSRNSKMSASSHNTWNQWNASSILELRCTVHEVTVVEIVHHFHQLHLVHSVTIYSSQKVFGGAHVNFIRKKLNEALKPLDCLGFH